MNGPGRDPLRPQRDGDSSGQLEQLEFLRLPDRPGAARPRRKTEPVEYKVISLRDCPLPDRLHECDTPQKAADYWRLHVATLPAFNPDVETCVVLHLTARRRVRGHHLVATGTLDTLLVHSREVFRAAIVAASQAVLVMHNHPSLDPTPSEADIRVTRDLIRAGQILKIEVLDHVIVAGQRHVSLKECGYFFS